MHLAVAPVDLGWRRCCLDRCERLKNPVAVLRTFRHQPGISRGKLDQLTFEVQRGEVFAFLGPNGAGKTTTIKMLTTLLKPK